MTAQARPVTFTNALGHRLVGILHEPASPRHDFAVVLLAAGVKARVGPHGLYRQLADMLVDRGFTVLRFDFWGLGDSDGTAPEPLLADLYGSVSCGRFVDDTRAAVQFACDAAGVPGVILAGLCGGAITGVLAGARDSRIAGVLALGLPVSVDGSQVDKVKYMSIGQLEGVRGKYFRKLTDPRSWARLLSLKTDYRLLARSLMAPLMKKRPAATPTAAVAAAPDDNMNPHFRPSLLKMLAAKQPVMLLFSEADRLYWEFREKFVERYRFDPADYADTLDIAIVKDANHIFTFKEWQADMLARSGAWLDARFPADATASGGRSDLSRRAVMAAIPVLLTGSMALLSAAAADVQPAPPRGGSSTGVNGEQSMPSTTSGAIVLLGASYAGGWQLPAIAGRTVVNRGVQGEQSWEMLERFDRDVTAARPSAVILWGCINDVFRSPREGMDAALNRVEDSFKQMIARARTAGIEPIVATEVTIRPKDEWSETLASWVGWAMSKQSYQDYINGRVAELNRRLRQLAATEHVLLLDLQPVLSEAGGQRRKEFSKEDGSHITPAGYAALTAYTVPALERHFRGGSD